MTTPTPQDGAAGEPNPRICQICNRHENTHIGIAKACFGGLGTVFIPETQRFKPCYICGGTPATGHLSICSAVGFTPDPSGAPTSDADSAPKPLAPICQNCGYHIDGTSVICTHCGTPFPSSPVAAETGTPKTDQATCSIEELVRDHESGELIRFDFVTSDFARTIERELSQAKSEVERLKEELDEARRNETGARMNCDMNESLTQALKADLTTARAQLEEATEQWKEGRKQGRQEALSLLLRVDAESFPTEYQRNYEIGCTGDFGVAWSEDNLKALLEVDSTHSMVERFDGAMWEAIGDKDQAELERDIAKRRGEELERHIDQVGLFFAGTEHQHIADKAIQILKGNGEVEGWLRQQRAKLDSLRAKLAEAEKERDLHKEHEGLNAEEAVWFQDALGLKDVPIGVDGHKLAQEKLRDMIAREDTLTAALAAFADPERWILESGEWRWIPNFESPEPIINPQEFARSQQSKGGAE